MITLQEYVGHHVNSPDWNADRRKTAAAFLDKIEPLYDEMVADGVHFPINPNTQSQVSGQMYGGFRPQSCPQGAPQSSHKEGCGVDWYDPLNEIDDWLMAHQDRLEHYGVYIEHPDATDTWSHWTTRAPKSGRHVFRP